MSVYTKTGDKGETKVFDKETGKLVGISKKSCKIKAVGAIDELNSFLGVVISFSQEIEIERKLKEIQANLFTINSILAGAKLRFSKTKVKKLEKQIDKWEGSLPAQKNFIYYGGSVESSLLFYARALARRAERSLVSLKIPASRFQILAYVNRLSDYLFMLARGTNFKAKILETSWKGKF